MTRAELKAKADQRGYTLHESVTDARLAVMEPALMIGHAVAPKKMAQHLDDVTAYQIAEWERNGCLVVPYRLGRVGEIVVAPPRVDRALALVVLPSYLVVAHTSGGGESFDGEHASSIDLCYTVIRAA